MFSRFKADVDALKRRQKLFASFSTIKPKDHAEWQNSRESRIQGTEDSYVSILGIQSSAKFRLKFGYNRNPDENESHRTLLACIDRGLEVFGASVKEVVYWGMEQDLGIKREEIPMKASLFAQFMETMFGAGYAVVETVLVKELRLCAGAERLASNKLADAINEVHNLLEQGLTC